MTRPAKPHKTKVRAAAQANLIRPRYTSVGNGQAPGFVEAYYLRGSNRHGHSQDSPGVIEGGASGQEPQEPGRPHCAPEDWQRCLGNHNQGSGTAGESEKPIVAGKPCNWG
ncbi:MAG TPA: hypothetical protein VKA68_06600, partial [bacterium]|nr:hypothetical protein [bacterium]